MAGPMRGASATEKHGSKNHQTVGTCGTDSGLCRMATELCRARRQTKRGSAMAPVCGTHAGKDARPQPRRRLAAMARKRLGEAGVPGEVLGRSDALEVAERAAVPWRVASARCAGGAQVEGVDEGRRTNAAQIAILCARVVADQCSGCAAGARGGEAQTNSVVYVCRQDAASRRRRRV